MSDLFSNIDPLEINRRLDAGFSVITVNKRLSRELHLQYCNHSTSAGLNAWETPSIIPFEAWLRNLWDQVNANSAPPHQENNISRGVVLNALQIKAVWKKIIQADIAKYNPDTQPLWAINATTRAATHAWQISQSWNIDLQSCRHSEAPDYRQFAAWADTYNKVCRSNNWIDPESLPNLLVRSLADYAEKSNSNVHKESISHAPSNLNLQGIVLAGFDQLTSQQTRLFETLRDIGISIEESRPSRKSTTQIKHYEFASEYQQWLAAAHWARKKLQETPQARLAIIAPDLRRSRRLIEHSLSQILCPGDLTRNHSRNPVFHISPGKPLIEFPVVHRGLSLLWFLSGNALDANALQNLLLSPFLAGSDTEFLERSELDIALRARLPFRFDIHQLLSTTTLFQEKNPTPVFLETLGLIVDYQDRCTRKKDFSDWTEVFLRCLNMFGFPGPITLESAEFQAVDALKSELKKMATLDIVSDTVSINTALGYLKTRLGEQLFEVESLNPSVEILDIPESSGIRFDSIWFGGMISNDWPASPSPSPFIQTRFQRESGYPRASVELNLQLAETQQTRLLGQTAEMIFSYHAYDKDVEISPSPLFALSAQGARQPKEQIFENIDTLFALLQEKQPEMETYRDSQGLIHDGGKTTGGTRLLEDQAACAFRAYANLRLGCRLTEPREQGVDALDRGQLVHQVLEDIWTELGSSQALKKLSEQELRDRVRKSIGNRSKKLIVASGCERGFLNAHSLWLEELLIVWLALEKDRNLDFSLAGAEIPTTLEIEGITLQFKIDRVDQLADGSLCLIDYKTGEAASLKKWVGDRPQYPQLALYCLALESMDQDTKPPMVLSQQGKGLSALVVGQVKSGKILFRGFCIDNQFYRDGVGSKSVPLIENSQLPEELKNWDALKTSWQNNLSGLVRDFQQGIAVVDPLDAVTCTYCDLHALCRIHQKAQLQ